ncbi:MAG: alanine racemase [Candidatus Handelsmanbacteria bacterium]|nr:alanine racemase [Candidatus Handelsmanbacteria bacterium]
MHFTELDTPALVVDLDVLEKNIRDLQADCNHIGIPLRSHTKTHRTPQIAQMQIAEGAIGIACQKLGDAEVMAAAGIRDILIPYNLVGKAKLERLTRLIRGSSTVLTVAADSAATVEGLSARADKDACRIRVIVEMDCGGHRCGTQSPQATLELAQRIDQLPGLDFTGVMTYAGGEKVAPFLAEVRDLTQKAGLPLHMVSNGGTGSQAFCKSLGCTETRIGSYVFEGMTRVGRREDLHPDRCPVRVVVTVVSTAVRGQIIVDGGIKAFTSYPPTPYGYCLEHPEIWIREVSIEHGHVDITQSTHKFEVGEILSFIPLHGEMTTNLYEYTHPMRQGQIVDKWRVLGRGQSQ